jgi:hypothetical protein
MSQTLILAAASSKLSMTGATKSCPHALPKRALKALEQLPCTALTKRANKALVQFLLHPLTKRVFKALVQAKRAFKALALQISPPQASTQRRVPRVAKTSGEIFLKRMAILPPTLRKSMRIITTKMRDQIIEMNQIGRMLE